MEDQKKVDKGSDNVRAKSPDVRGGRAVEGLSDNIAHLVRRASFSDRMPWVEVSNRSASGDLKTIRVGDIPADRFIDVTDGDRTWRFSHLTVEIINESADVCPWCGFDLKREPLSDELLCANPKCGGQPVDRDQTLISDLRRQRNQLHDVLIRCQAFLQNIDSIATENRAGLLESIHGVLTHEQ